MHIIVHIGGNDLDCHNCNNETAKKLLFFNGETKKQMDEPRTRLDKWQVSLGIKFDALIVRNNLHSNCYCFITVRIVFT
jgi:hypothetical protein